MSRGTALVLTPQLPWPLDDGGRLGLHQMTWSVARAYDTTLLSMVREDGAPPPPPREWQGVPLQVRTVLHTPPPQWRSALAGSLGRWPYTLARYRSRAYAAAIREEVARLAPRVVLINHLHLAPYLDDVAAGTTVLREHNVETRWLERIAERAPQPWVRAFARFQARRMRRTEAELCGRTDLVLAIHEEEASLLRSWQPRARVEVVPVGIDPSRFHPRAPVDPPTILLTGAFGWGPNAEGARRFLAQGWPRVRARFPAARLRLVGKDMPGDLASLARESGAEPVGYVDDITPEFASATLMVVPLWVGAGMRVKIVEAALAGLPVVSTPLGAEGLGFADGEHGALAEEASALGDRVADALADPQRREGMATRSRTAAMQRWSLAAVADRTVDLIEQAVARRAAATGAGEP